MPFLTLFLGGAFRRLLDALKWCLERPAIAVAVLSLVLAAFFYIKADHLSTRLKNARAEIIQLTNERKEAIRYATAEKARLETERKKITDEADKTLRIALADADARLRAYAKANRAKADLSGSPAVAELDNGSDPTAILVSYSDAERCTAAVVRLQNAQDWARKTYSISLEN